MCIAVFYGRVITGGSNFTVTVDPPGSNQYWMTTSIHEYRGIVAASPADQSLSATGTGASVSPGSMPTTTNANNLIFTAFTHNASTNIEANPGTGFRMKTYYTDGTNEPLYTQDRIVSSTGDYAGTLVFASSIGWRGVVVALKGS